MQKLIKALKGNVMKTITIGNSDEDADWLKNIGKAKQADLQAADDALKLHKLKKFFKKIKKSK